MLEVATNTRFNPEHFPSMSLRTVEQKLVKTIFPNGHRTADLTRPEDGDQKIIFHYIPFTECASRQLSRRAFAGTSTWSMSHRSAQGIQGPVDSAGWTPEPGLRQRSCGQTSWRPLLEGGGPNVRWQGWSGSAMPPSAARTRLGTAFTVRLKPAIYQDVTAGCM